MMLHVTKHMFNSIFCPRSPLIKKMIQEGALGSRTTRTTMHNPTSAQNNYGLCIRLHYTSACSIVVIFPRVLIIYCILVQLFVALMCVLCIVQFLVYMATKHQIQDLRYSCELSKLVWGNPHKASGKHGKQHPVNFKGAQEQHQ